MKIYKKDITQKNRANNSSVEDLSIDKNYIIILATYLEICNYNKMLNIKDSKDVIRLLSKKNNFVNKGEKK